MTEPGVLPAQATLAIAIVCEVAATSLLKATDGFTKPLSTIFVLMLYGAAFYFLALTLRSMPVGIAYAIWCGVGIVMVALIAWLAYGQRLDGLSLFGMVLIIAGAVVLNIRAAA